MFLRHPHHFEILQLGYRGRLPKLIALLDWLLLVYAVEYWLFLFETHTFRLPDELELPLMHISQLPFQLTYDPITNSMEFWRLKEAILIMGENGEFSGEVVEGHHFFSLQFGDIVQ